MKVFRIKKPETIFELFHLFYIVGKPCGLSCYTTSIDTNNHSKTLIKTKIYVTPLNVFVLIISLLYNCLFALYYINETIMIKNSTSNESILNYGLQFTLIMSHVLSALSVVVIFISRNFNWNIIMKMHYVDEKVVLFFFYF